MIIIVVLIGAFVMNYVLVKIYGHLWEKDLDARVEFQKEPSVESEMAVPSGVTGWFSDAPESPVCRRGKYKCLGSVL